MITSWSAVSPYGLTRSGFARGVRRDVAEAGFGTGSAAPMGRPRVVPDFDVAREVGPKGTRAWNRMTGLAVAAVGQLLTDTPDLVADDLAVVLGTTTGSADNMTAFTRASLEAERPHYVDPAHVPMIILNCAAGNSAIRHGLRGPNATIAGGHVAGHLGLSYARRLLGTGRASAVLCGAAEEFSPIRARLAASGRAAGATGPAPEPGEGAAIMLVERGDRTPRPVLAEILAVRTAVAGRSVDLDLDIAMSRCVRRALAAAEVLPDQVWVAAVGGQGAPAASAALVHGVGADTVVVAHGALVGDTAAVTASFGVAVCLSLAEDLDPDQQRVGVVTSADPAGVVGATVLRLYGAAGRSAVAA